MSHDQYLSFKGIEEVLYEFEASIGDLDIAVEPSSDLGRISLNIMGLVARRDKPELRPAHEDVRHYFRDILGLRTFMTKVVILRQHPDFKKLRPHLTLLNEGRVPQNTPSGIQDDSSRKLFELLIAMAAMQIGSDIELDHPTLSGGGKNPDILVTVDGVCYGIACKALTGPTSQTLVQHLEKGIDQIEKSRADTGFVVFNIKNILDHDNFWPSPEQFFQRTGERVDCVAADYVAVVNRVAAVGSARILDLENTVGLVPLVQMFNSKKASPSIVHFLQTATAAATASGPVPTSILFLHLHGFGVGFMTKLNKALHA